MYFLISLADFRVSLLMGKRPHSCCDFGILGTNALHSLLFW